MLSLFTWSTLHCKISHAVAVLWQDNDDVVTTEGYKTMYLCLFDAYTVTSLCVIGYLVAAHVVTV